ncbi:helix-hairpin-helix domain-containing protein [Peribacillus loiseleuriae]|uniref:helix-hairpin-helix domain-containing protein n=1 Tax=Peribacillus loiseleuriae TaxID=1679170 RepID=UPI003CFEBD88
MKGAVNRPGVYIAAAGDRVIDLIADAGDFTKEADKDQVNLAQVVEDQMVILVPRIGDESGLATVPMTSSGGSSDGKINLNTATQAELETLTGVGPSKALSIIDYREKTGKFQSVEDLKKISGIGDKTFEKLKDSIKVK